MSTSLQLVLQAWLQDAQDRTSFQVGLSQIQATLSFVVLRLQTLEAKVDQLMSGNATLNTELDTLHQQVTANGDVTSSAVALLNGFGAKLAAVQAQLEAQGVSAAQLTSLTDFTSQLQDQKDKLAQAVAANTVADPATSGGASTSSGGASTGSTGTDTGTSTSSDGTATADQPQA